MPLIELSAITADQKAQPRTSIHVDKVAEYTEDMERGDKFPPLVVFFDATRYWLADGFHRFYAATGAGKAKIMCDVREGGLREAVLYSCGANASHGVRRTNQDKQRAVAKLLEDAEWSKWSDSEVGRQCSVSHTFVAKLRKEFVTCNVASEERTYETKHGTIARMNTTAIGRPTPDDGKIIADTLRDMERCIDYMPTPRQAVSIFPQDQRYFFPVSKLEQMAAWMADFAAAWRASIAEKAHADV